MAITITGGASFSGGSLFTVLSVPTDAQFNYVSALFSGEGTNTAQNNTFVDGSTNNFTITRNGTPTQGSFSPYGSNWSNYFNGTNQYLIAPSGSSTFGTGDFTVECWIYKTSATDGPLLGNATGNADNNYWSFSSLANGTISMGIRDSAAAPVSVTGSISSNLNTWVHVAVTRQSGLVRLFVNGVLDNSGTITKSVTARTTDIGSFQYTGFESYFPGYMSNVRIVTGVAVYTASFTPPTAPLTAIANTSLLTCQSNRFVDKSTNAFGITISGSPSVHRYNPFGTDTTYSTSTIGGSGYFNGSTDYLTTPNNAAIQLETASIFTVEAWIYITGVPSGSTQMTIVGTRGSSSTTGWEIRLNTSRQIQFYYTGTSVSNTFSSTVLSLNTWYHIAFVRNSSTGTIFINGAVDTQNTSMTNGTTNSNVLTIGCEGTDTTSLFFGYVSNLRIVNGTAVYTAAFTPPTAPLTAITNTSLLLNYTNAGIYDNAMINNAITVGAAQISTAQYKFGSSSMSFNGTTSYLTAPANNLYNIYSGAFTIEMWVYRIGNGSGGTSALDTLLGSNNSFNSVYGIYINRTTGVISFYTASGGLVSSSNTLSNSTWTHIAVCRTSSNNLQIFINGTSGYSASYTGTATLINPLYIANDGTGASGNNLFYGYMDDFRFTAGYARYTSNFTAPTSAFPTLGP